MVYVARQPDAAHEQLLTHVWPEVPPIGAGSMLRAACDRLNAAASKDIAAIMQIRHDPEGGPDYGASSTTESPIEELRCLKPCPTSFTANSPPTPPPTDRQPHDQAGPEGQCGATQTANAVDLPPPIDNRISHVPDPPSRRYPRPPRPPSAARSRRPEYRRSTMRLATW